MSPHVVSLSSHVFPLPHMVQWQVPNDVPQRVSICSSCNFLNFSNIIYHSFLIPNDVPMCSHPHTWLNDMFPMMFSCVLTITHGSMMCSQWCSHVFSPSHMVQWHVPNDVPICSHPHTWFNDMFPMMLPNLCFMWFLKFLQYSLPLFSNSLCCSPNSHVFPP